ncbi:MAG: hypothetical protein LBI03_06545 [Clostridiales bacterium]|jgi:hypothetical protein|nr:hypothetical protein [Clostridiales bacterium]
MKTEEKSLYTLVSLEKFKSILGIDDRDDKLSKFCLVTATLTIEQFCKRKLIQKKCCEVIQTIGDNYFPLREYPVTNVLAVFETANGGIIEDEFYHVIPNIGTNEDIPFSVELSPAYARMGCRAIKVIYCAGYKKGAVPADLAAACLELASWNFNRYKGHLIGVNENFKTSSKEGGHFEMSMPENVKLLLEPYRRKTI